MSDTSPGPGWWQASDGKWYSPEQVPGPLPPTSAYPGPIAPGHTVPTSIPSSGPKVPPAVPDGGTQTGSDAGGSLAGSAWSPPPAPGYGTAQHYGSAPTAPGYGPQPTPGYGDGPPPGAPGYGSPTGYSPYGFVPATKTNGLAVASLICSLLWMFGVGAVLAVVFGFLARSQISHSDGG